MERDISKPVQKSFGSVVFSVLHRLLVVFMRFLCKNVIYGAKGKSMPPIKNPLLLEPASVLAEKIRTKKVTSVEVMKAFIERVHEVNELLNCVVDERFAYAMKEAEEADRLVASGEWTEEELRTKKPFLGVPISTKDCIMVNEMLNTSGLYHRKDVRAHEDAPPIKQMREAGAIPFALTNTSELCMWWESNNHVHGRSKNPYDTNRIVGGSSGGEGAIQASAASPFGIGADIGGSIRMPAFFNGVFGHKPSKNVVSNNCQHPIPNSKDQNNMEGTGPLCRFAVDLLPMLKVISMKDKLPLLKLDEPVEIKKLKIFYQENDLGGPFIDKVDKDIQEAFRKVINYFKNTTKNEVNKVQIQRTKNASAIWLANMKSKNAPSFHSQIAGPGKSFNGWIELVKSIFGQSIHTFIAIFTALTETSGAKPGSAEHKYLLSERDKLTEEFREMLKDDMSVFLYPTHPTVAIYHNESILRAFNFSYTSLINILGMPACNIPLGLGKEGLPLGIQVVANYNNDRLCLAVARELEKAFGGWQSPEVL